MRIARYTWPIASRRCRLVVAEGIFTGDASIAHTIDDARQQFARFGSKCRLYAPLYRQVTLAGLRQAMAGGGILSLDRGVGYDDVRDAWNCYLAHDNKGRGVVLFGHSQGSFVLMELIRREIDGRPGQSRLVSAVLLGTTLPVPGAGELGPPPHRRQSRHGQSRRPRRSAGERLRRQSDSVGSVTCHDSIHSSELGVDGSGEFIGRDWRSDLARSRRGARAIGGAFNLNADIRTV